MRDFTLFFFLIGFISSQGQNYFASNSIWNYVFTEHSGGFQSNWTIAITSDTVVNGFETHRLTKYYADIFSLPPNPPPSSGSQFFGYLQVRNDSVFYDYFIPNPGRFLFSFMMQPGDTIPIPTVSSQVLIAVVDTLCTTIINGDTLKKWGLTKYCDTAFFGNATIIEKIGQVDDYLLWNTDGCELGYGGWTFQCFSGGNLAYNPPCLPVSSGEIKNESPFPLFPNPAVSFITITGPAESLYLYDIQGRIITQKSRLNSTELNVDVSFLKPGTYYLRLVSDGAHSIHKLIKIEE